MTSLANMSYQERRKLYGQGNFPAGFEYYTGGIITAGEVLKSTAISEMVEEWDWRNRHGQNWITPVKNQAQCGSCWAFSATGTTEAMVKVFFNQSDLDLDLSEQDVLSCSGAGTCDGGNATSALYYIQNTGIVDEGTFPYTATDQPCENKGLTPSEKIKISGQIGLGSSEYPNTEDGLKKMLIEKGPLSISVNNWWHAIVLVGWKVVKEGDVFFYQGLRAEYTHDIIIEPGDPLIGTTVWLMKNSWGSNWGDNGYVYVQSEMSNLYARAIITPIVSMVQNYDVVCEDNDGDGYFWWGLGEKPATCDCPEIPDGDDSDPNLGPLDEYGNCIILGNPPVADFTVDDQNVYIGDEVIFKDKSTGGAMSWYWEFGDGETSTLRNPVHKYLSEGEYSVTLLVSNSYGADTLIKNNYITVNENVWFRQDSLALVALYNSTNGPNWTNNDNWLSGPLNTWYGIELNDSNRVSVINLTENNLQEVLPEEIGQLSALTELLLSNNYLVEAIPQTWEPNPNLWTIDLSYNQLGGEIPGNWSAFTGLARLLLNNNQLTDSLRSWYVNFTNLSVLQINNNALFGNIPSNWKNMRSLSSLSLAGNQLSGSLPDCIGSMYELSFLNLGNNDFSGSIPESWSAIRSIRNLYLYGNQLNGTLPDWLGNWRQLSWLYLNDNHFTGVVPANWSNLSNLNGVNLGYNQLEGDLPVFVADSSGSVNLRYLILSINSFSGAIPSEWASYSDLEHLDLAQNELSDPIPDELCVLDTLDYINLSYNYFDSTSCSTVQCMLDKGFIFSDTVQTQKNGFNLLTDCQKSTDYDELSMNTYVSDAFCYGSEGWIIVSISGGLGGSYGLGGQNPEALTDNNSYTVLVYDINSQKFVEEFVLHDDEDSTGFTVVPGNYQIIVEDAVGHESQTMAEIMQPDQLILTIPVISGPFCAEDSAAFVELTGIGGVPPYSFSIYRNGEIFNTWNQSNYYELLPEGYYEFFITDANGCIATDSLILQKPDSILFEVQDISCFGDSLATAKLTIENGLPGQLYKVFYSLYENGSWISNNSTDFFDQQVYISDLSFDGGQQVNSYYVFNVMNAEGCYSEGKTMAFSSASEQLLVDINTLNVNEINADIQIQITGGTAPYRLEFDSVEITDQFQTVSTGYHTFIVQDAHDCFIDGTVLIEPDYDCPQHFHPVWEGKGVYDPMNIYIIGAKVEGEDLVPGDQVGVFDYGLCVGYGFVTETISHQNLLNIVVSANDGTGNGFISGHDISYKIWKCSDEKEFDGINVNCYDNQLNPVNCSTFNSGGSSFVQLNGTSQIGFATGFQPGWNIFSLPVVPDTADMQFVFDDLINANTLVKIQDETGNSLEDFGIFGGWHNYIGDVRPTEGYKIKLNDFDSLFCSGAVVNYPFGIPLNHGWNLMGFPSFSYVNGMEVVQQLIDRESLIKVQNEQGYSIENLGVFGGWQNFIGNFWAGKGFKIKLNSPDTLWVYESYSKSAKVEKGKAELRHFNLAYEGNGTDHMNFNLVQLPTDIINEGDEIAVFDGTTCVGATVISADNLQSQVVSIPASATDDLAMTGFTEDDKYSLRLWKANQNIETNIEAEYVSGSKEFTKNESVILSLEKSALTDTGEIIGNDMTEVNCYPNPFSDEIVIELDLVKESEVKIEVLNILGQSVKTFNNEKYLPVGINRVKWNGKNDTGALVPEGIYNLHININETVLNRKIIYSKNGY